MPEYEYLETTELLPSKLQYHRDTVKFEVSGKIPIISVLLPRNPKLRLEFSYGDSRVDFGEIPLTKTVSDYSYKESFEIPYEPWMEKGLLKLLLFQGKKESPEPYETKIIAKGVVTTPLLAKVGKVQANEPIPNVGLFIPTGLLDVDNSSTSTFEFLFEAGEAEFKSGYKGNQTELTALQEFLITNPSIESFQITGLQSPEQDEGRNSKLGFERAKTVQDFFLVNRFLLDSSKVELKSRWNDWFDFRLLLRDYDKFSSGQRDAYYDILTSEEPYETQREKLSELNGFRNVSRDLYPRLRAVKVELKASPVEGLNQKQIEILKRVLSGEIYNSELTVTDWALAGETAPRLRDKEEIYIKMTELFRSALPYNNLAVVKMREAQRSLDQSLRDSLLHKAMVLLRQAERIESSPYILHNIGQILILNGENWEAYKKLSDASVMTRRSDFLKINESLRGALDIIRGDYKLATLRFEYEYSEPKDFFNKGLAYYMAKDYVKATEFFEESVLAGRDYGYGFYGLALVAAASNQNDIALLNLRKAISSNEVIYQKALIDPTLEELRDTPEFFELFRMSAQ
ncbi:TPR end-of-group domain-containing protein [Algoriphagus sediminis]|uniref:Tetratricopeptide repeat protein n=1 Tax=Algoriphagus sediminis TaxID=3057113 RepID=A0ABT7YH90_9BACT|nr:hypothetical protein [Algoriphagus sediminis]MDN3205725.1 hypothetical protein [Algoriphagus sediminis]